MPCKAFLKGIPRQTPYSSIVVGEYELMSLSLNDDLLFKRHYTLPRAAQIHIEFTQNAELLHQYYALRSLNLADSPKKLRVIESTENDNRAQIIVIRNGIQVVGGGRVIIRQHTKDAPLSIEHPEMPLSGLLKTLPISNKPYAEISKVFVLEEFATDATLETFYQSVADSLHENGVRHAFATCKLPLPEQPSLTSSYSLSTLNPHKAFEHQMARRFYQRLTMMDCLMHEASAPIKSPSKELEI